MVTFITKVIEEITYLLRRERPSALCSLDAALEIVSLLIGLLQLLFIQKSVSPTLHRYYNCMQGKAEKEVIS